MENVVLFNAQLAAMYDALLLTFPEDSKWYRLDSTTNPDLLKYIIEQWHRFGIMSFSFSADGERFKKDFNIDHNLVNSILTNLKQ